MATRNLIDLLLLAAAWGASYLFMRIATPEFGTFALIEIRVVIAAMFLIPIWLFRAKKSHKDKTFSNRNAIFMVGILNSAIPFSLIAFSTLHLTGGFAAIINATTPLWGALVAWIWLRESLSSTAIYGLIAGFVGVVVLVWDVITWPLVDSPTGFGFITGSNAAIIAGMAASLFYGIAANYTRQNLTDVSPLSIATFSQVSAAIVLLPLAIIYWPTQTISLTAWFSVIAMGIFSTGIAYILYFRLIANVGSTQAVSVTFLIPIFASVWGVVFINESITPQMIFGSLIILFGTGWVTGLINTRLFKKNV